MKSITKTELNKACELIDKQGKVHRYLLHDGNCACMIGCLLEALFPDFQIPDYGDFRKKGITYLFFETQYGIPTSVFIDMAYFNDEKAQTLDELKTYLKTKLEIFTKED